MQCIDTAAQDKETEESLRNNASSWTMGLDYFRLDGSTSVENRNIWCKTFNREDNHRFVNKSLKVIYWVCTGCTSCQK